MAELISAASNSVSTLHDVTISIIVPAWRLPDSLSACLAAIQDSVGAPNFEVIVVVNGSDPEVLQVALAHQVVTRVLTTPANVGFGMACNLGAKSAGGKFLAFINDDALIFPDWLHQLAAFLDSHPAAALVGSLLRGDDGIVAEAGAMMGADGHPTLLGSHLPLAEVKAQGLLEPRQVDYGSGAAFLVRAELFLKVGGFDYAYAPAYYEDVDLAFRIRQAGYQIWVNPKAQATHVANSSTASDTTFRDFAIAHSRAVFLDRWVGLRRSSGTEWALRGPLPEVALAHHELQSHDLMREAYAIQVRYAQYLASQLAQSKDETAASETRASTLHAEVTQLRARQAMFADELAAANGVAAALDDEVERLLWQHRAAAAQLEYMTGSFSWRVTRPIRAALGIFASGRAAYIDGAAQPP